MFPVMVLEYPRNVLLQDADEALNLEGMRELQKEFAKEAFIYLEGRHRMWMYYPQFLFSMTTDFDDDVMFTTSVGKAIVTMAYLRKVAIREKYQEFVDGNRHLDFEQFPDMFRTYIMSYPIRKEEMYFWDFLEWVTFALFTCIHVAEEHGTTYFSKGQECVAGYPDVEYFNKRGGWYVLIECSKHLEKIYDRMTAVSVAGLLKDVNFLPFLKAEENLKKQENRSILKVTPEMKVLKEIRKKLAEKYANVYEYISNLRISHFVRGNDFSSNVSESTNADCSKSVIIARESYLIFKKHMFYDEWQDDPKQILSFSEMESENKQLNRFLYENIENYTELGDDIYVICPSGCTIDDEDTEIIAVMSALEKEEDFLKSIIEALEKYRSKLDNTRSESRAAQKLKCSAKIPSEQVECANFKY